MKKGLLANKMFDEETTVEVKEKNILTGASLYITSGLENDLGNIEEDNSLKIEIELDLSMLNNTAVEIEIEFKKINALVDNIKVDEKAMAANVENRGVIDYSIMNYNQLSKEQQLPPLELGGLESALDSIREGFKYVIDNKKEILMKAWEKLVELYNLFLKTLGNFWKKIKLGVSQLKNYPKQVQEMLSVMPQDQPVDISMLSKETKEAILKSFSMFALSMDSKVFSLGKTTDTDLIRDTFSDKMYLNTDRIIETGMLEKRDVKILNYLSNPDILNKNFDPVSTSLTGGFKIDYNSCMPLTFLGTRAFFLFTDKVVDIFGKDLTSNNPDDKLRIVVESSNIKDTMLKELTINLGTYGDIVSVTKILGEFLNDGATKAIDKQIKDTDKLDKKIAELNKAWHTVKSSSLDELEKEIKKFNQIYAILKSVVELNITMSLNLNKDITRTLGMIASDTKMNKGGK